jgi:serine/threonine protein kinase
MATSKQCVTRLSVNVTVAESPLYQVNVLVDEGRMARLADFGVATVLHNSTTAATTVTGKGVGGTVRLQHTFQDMPADLDSQVRWQAPELHGSFDSEDEDAACPSVRSDVYALAVTIWEASHVSQVEARLAHSLSLAFHPARSVPSGPS